jgi:hypothetical protein
MSKKVFICPQCNDEFKSLAVLIAHKKLFCSKRFQSTKDKTQNRIMLDKKQKKGE